MEGTVELETLWIVIVTTARALPVDMYELVSNMTRDHDVHIGFPKTKKSLPPATLDITQQIPTQTPLALTSDDPRIQQVRVPHLSYTIAPYYARFR